jgi:excinuclease ABC subunit B
LNEDASGFNAAELIRELESDMADAASRLEYERAALLRDQITELKNGTATSIPSRKKTSYPKPSRKKRG